MKVALPPASSRSSQPILGMTDPGGENHCSGSVKANVEPFPTVLLTQILPPWSSMNLREMASPQPGAFHFLRRRPDLAELNVVGQTLRRIAECQLECLLIVHSCAFRREARALVGREACGQ
jgi:hypothetical protein